MSAARAALQRLREAATDGRLDTLARRHHIRVLGALDTIHDGLPVYVDFERGMERDTVAVTAGLSTFLAFEHVRVVHLRTADPETALGIVESEPLYESERGQFAEAEIRAMTMWMDTAWLRDLRDELVATAAGEGTA